MHICNHMSSLGMIWSLTNSRQVVAVSAGERSIKVVLNLLMPSPHLRELEW